MTAASVHIIFKTVVVSKLVYAASSRWGFAMADDQKRLQGVIRRGIRSGLCEQHRKTVEELVEEADDKLFTSVMYNKQHVLRPTLPGTMDTKYHLRPRPTTLSSPQRTDLSLNAILLLGCFLKTFIDIMLVTLLFYVLTFLFCLSALTLSVGQQEGHPACKKTEWWVAGVVICLAQRAQLHTAQLMPLPLTVSFFSKIQIGFTFLVLAHLGKR